ncbi:MAG: DUF1269 domain-containing protein [Chloroflexi bacterium]|nr:DUF1269 domain-containing protein [Chloroflexota bacterium]MCI0832879.1 DUF1269 domain-containing protein [Chloroflexota bacterium]
MNEVASPISVFAAFYNNEEQAGKLLTRLKTLDKDGAINIIDAAVMVKADDGRKVKVIETAEFTPKKGAGRGAVLGGVLGIIFPPSILVMGAVGAAAGAALGHFTDQGFNNNLLKEIGENLPPGGSCIVAVVEEKWVTQLTTALEGYADLARYALDAEASAKLTSEIRG